LFFYAVFHLLMKYTALLIAALGSGAARCHKQDTVPTPTVTDSLQLLNEQGQPATVFAQGQNIVFRFQVKNNSDQSIFLPNPVFDPTTFLAVYTRARVSFGKPYEYIFCTYQGGIPLAAGQTYTFSIPWVEAAAYSTTAQFCRHAATTYLPLGRYQTHFAPSFAWTQQGTLTTPGVSQSLAAQEFSYEFEVK
jgi:hypothetical protein